MCWDPDQAVKTAGARADYLPPSNTEVYKEQHRYTPLHIDSITK
jgi:hypothetical protein